jgi:hypothetical protein
MTTKNACSLLDNTHPGINRSHWMSPLGECSHQLNPAVDVVINGAENKKNTNRKQL